MKIMCNDNSIKYRFSELDASDQQYILDNWRSDYALATYINRCLFSDLLNDLYYSAYEYLKAYKNPKSSSEYFDAVTKYQNVFVNLDEKDIKYVINGITEVKLDLDINQRGVKTDRYGAFLFVDWSCDVGYTIYQCLVFQYENKNARPIPVSWRDVNNIDKVLSESTLSVDEIEEIRQFMLRTQQFLDLLNDDVIWVNEHLDPSDDYAKDSITTLYTIKFVLGSNDKYHAVIE